MSGQTLEKTPEYLDLDSDPVIKRRVKALKGLQIEAMKVNGELQKEVLQLFVEKFGQKLDEIHAKRRDIISGKVEPTEEECHYEFESFDGTDSESETKEDSPTDTPKTFVGIPGFWLKVMMNCTAVREAIAEKDEEVLFHLIDIRVTSSEVKDETFRQVLEFTFSPNKYFSNKVLRKEYLLKFGVDPKNPWDVLMGYYPIEMKGCKIDWKNTWKGLKMQKNYGPYSSFFEFFTPPQPPKNEDDKNYEDYEDDFYMDWNLATYLTKKVVPNAVLYYTGDVVESEASSSNSSDDSWTTDESEEESVHD